jgi:hypothetical protein
MEEYIDASVMIGNDVDGARGMVEVKDDGTVWVYDKVTKRLVLRTTINQCSIKIIKE